MKNGPPDSPAPTAANPGTPHSGVEVAAGLIFRNGVLLITQRRADGHLGGLWEFPGGKREPSETFEECLRRELREELGIDVIVAELLETITHTYLGQSVHLKFYRCTLRCGEPKAIGCDALAWIQADDLGAYSFPPADERLLERLRQTPELWR
jgi:mutator protein MutT